MFSRSHALVSSLLLSAVLGSAGAQALTGEQRAAIEALGERWDKSDSPGFSVAIIRGQELIYTAGHGQAQLEFDAPIGPDTIFHVASLSKQFTAFALVLLARDGKLSLSDDVRKHVPWLHEFGTTITIRHLLNHTSGLRDQWELLVISGYSLEDVLTQTHILRLLRRQRELNFAPGAEYMYCNMGYSLAAHLVEVVSGETFAAFCAERIFTPLGMTRTHFHASHREVVPGRAYSYGATSGGWQNRVLSYANVGATSLFTTAPDLARWLANLSTGKVGGRDAVLALRKRGKLNDGREIAYALGLQVGGYRGHTVLRHGGADAGFRSHSVYLPDLDLGVAVLANAASASAGRIAGKILQQLVEPKPKPKKDRAAASPPPRSEPAGANADGTTAVEPIDLAKMAGRYLCPELDVFYEIVVEGDDVSVRNLRWGDLALRRDGPDTLVGQKFFLRKLVFERRGDEVTGCRLSGSRVRDLRFVRVR